MPICSFASAIRRSTAAISGRRSRSCDGSPTGNHGRLQVQRIGRQAELCRRFPQQDGDGVFVLRALDPNVRVGYARGIELSLRLGHVGFGRGAALIAGGGEPQRFGVGFDGVVEQALLRIRGAQFEVVVRPVRHAG